MGFDDLSNSGLLLGLGLTLPSNKPTITPQKPKIPLHFFNFPSLTLGLSTAEIHPASAADLGRQPSPQSGVSSVSGGRVVKREREVSGEEFEEEDGSNCRKKLRLTKQQSALLEGSFKLRTTLNPKEKLALATELNLRPRQVEVWFQNRRARTKLKQTEVDCEFLKRCCETLTDENSRLQKELQELKALNPFMSMPMPAATLTVCPSCKRIGGSGTTTVNDDGNTKGHRFYKPFANPSAAC